MAHVIQVMSLGQEVTSRTNLTIRQVMDLYHESLSRDQGHFLDPSRLISEVRNFFKLPATLKLTKRVVWDQDSRCKALLVPKRCALQGFLANKRTRPPRITVGPYAI